MHFELEVERMIRHMLRDNVIVEATKESKFCSCGIYKSMDNVFIQAQSSEDLELLVSTFFKCCPAQNVKISLKKIQLCTHVTFGDIYIDASSDDIDILPAQVQVRGGQELYFS